MHFILAHLLSVVHSDNFIQYQSRAISCDQNTKQTAVSFRCIPKFSYPRIEQNIQEKTLFIASLVELRAVTVGEHLSLCFLKCETNSKVYFCETLYCVSMMISFILILGTFAETFALQWTSSSTFPNGTLINVCLGDNVTFPWKYSVNSSERIIDVEWYYVSQDHETLLAAYIGDRFLAYGDLDRHLQFVPNAGLQLTGVTSSDMGQYTVHVNLNGQELSQTAFLHEPEAPITLSGTLQAYILPATQFPVINGESHLQLGCGDFQSLGEPPISVTWRTPSAQILSSTYNNGVFGLTLPNPIEGGNYTCEINGTSNAQRCLQDNSLLQTVSTVYVDEITSTLLLFRNDMEWLRQENARITEENARITEENARLQAYINQFELVDASIRPFSCLNVKDYDAVSRIHTIYPNGSHPVKVYCDQVIDNGGWTVIQRRQDGSVDFYRNWTEYESGFGNPESEYWIGLANLHSMTNGKTAILRVDLMDFNGTTAYAMYNTFNVSGPEDNYRLTVGGYNGTAGDDLKTDNNVQFSTYDRDHDALTRLNCALVYHGAWWYHACSNSNLNGRYYQISGESAEGIWWLSWRYNFQSLKRVEIKILV